MDPLDWSPGGRYLVYREMNRGTGWDLMLLPLQGDRTPITLLQTPESDSDAKVSPNGRWLADHSRLNGSSVDVFVQPFSGDGSIGLTGSRLQISNRDGAGPLWRRDGREIYYHTLTGGKVMAVPLQLTPRPQADRPQELFAADLNDTGLHIKDVAADGSKCLLVLKPRQKPPPPRLTVVTNWQARLGK